MAMTEREMVAIGDGVTKAAIALAAKESKAMGETMVVLMEAKEVTEQGAINLFIALRDTYGEELSSFPRPGSTVETSNNPDVIKVEKRNPQTGNKTVVRSSFYVTFADNTAEGKTVLQELGWLKILNNPEADKNLVPKEFAKLYPNPETRKIHSAYLEGRRNTIRKGYKDAMDLAYAMIDLNNLAQVQADFVWVDPEKMDKVVNTKKPIRVSSTKSADQWEYITQSTAKRFDCERAKENGGTFDALFETLKRSAEGDGGKGGNQNKPQLIRTVDTFEARIVDVHEALVHTWEADGKKLKSDITRKLQAENASDFRLSLSDLHQAIGQWLGNEKIAALLEADERKRDAAAKAA